MMQLPNAMPLAPFYREYELPWSPTEDVERRFKKILHIVLVIFVVLAILVTLLPVPEQTRVKAPDIPDRVVQMLIEKKPPPPPPPPPEVKQPEIKPEPVKVEPKPKPVEDAREKAKNTGLLKLQDQLADLRDNTILDKAAMTKNLTGKVNETTSAERSMITSKVGASSGGINTASLSRGYGTGAGSLEGHNTTQVTSAVLSAKPEDNVRRGGSGKASRSEEEIAMVFDRNAGSIHSMYQRALRDKPELKGKVVFQITISPAGEITKCEILSSELNDPELERKLAARIKLFRFEAKDVGTITVTKPIDFLPS